MDTSYKTRHSRMFSDTVHTVFHLGIWPILFISHHGHVLKDEPGMSNRMEEPVCLMQ